MFDRLGFAGLKALAKKGVAQAATSSNKTPESIPYPVNELLTRIGKH